MKVKNKVLHRNFDIRDKADTNNCNNEKGKQSPASFLRQASNASIPLSVVIAFQRGPVNLCGLDMATVVAYLLHILNNIKV